VVSGYPAAKPVNFAQRADGGVSVFAADFAVPVAVAIVETCLAHAALHCAHRREHPPAGTEWQLNYAREWHHPDDEGGPDAAFADGVNSGLSMNDRSNIYAANNAYARIGRAGPGLVGPGKSSPWISPRQ